MLTKLELTLDCTNADASAEFWKLAVGYRDVRGLAPFLRAPTSG